MILQSMCVTERGYMPLAHVRKRCAMSGTPLELEIIK